MILDKAYKAVLASLAESEFDSIIREKEPKAKEPKAKEPKAKEPKAKEPKAKEPKAKEKIDGLEAITNYLDRLHRYDDDTLSVRPRRKQLINPDHSSKIGFTRIADNLHTKQIEKIYQRQIIAKKRDARKKAIAEKKRLKTLDKC